MDSIGNSGVRRRSSSNPDLSRFQPIVVPNVLVLRRRLTEQDELIRRLRKEKDEQLRRISASLLLLESKLRRQKTYVDEILREKDRKIGEQDACIRALLRFNRKLVSNAQIQRERRQKYDTKSAKEGGERIGETEVKRRPNKQRRTISWHSKVSVYGEDGRRYRASFRDTNGRRDDDRRFPNLREVSEEEDEDDIGSENHGNGERDSVMAAKEACEAFGEVLDAYESDETSEGGIPSIGRFSRLRQSHPDGPPPHSPAVPVPSPPLSRPSFLILETAKDDNSEGRCESTMMGSSSFNPLPNKLGHVYNRVMSNHRSVTKPKDVKYKKISRVKSRSLEELRGQLKHVTQPILRHCGLTRSSSSSPSPTATEEGSEFTLN